MIDINKEDELIDAKVRSILSVMSLEEKINEMHGRGIAKLGLSFILTKKLIPVKAGGSDKHGIPPVIFLDGPRGVSFYKGATAFPVTMARGASWERDLEKRIGEAMASEIRALNANYSGAVCMNILRHPKWGRAQETYGEDSYHIGEMASALMDGIQKHSVQACAKHFAANSMENNRFGGSMNMDERTLYEIYLPHFKKVVGRGVASVMSAYNKLNGEYCGHSKLLLNDILRDQWKFKGYVTSDWEAGLFDTKKGIEAGMNIEMPSSKFYSNKKIKKLLYDKVITEQQIDNLVFPVLRTKLLFEKEKGNKKYPRSLLGCSEHIALAKEAAEKSAVLLKNENQLLPLDKNKIIRIAVIGSLADKRQTGDRGSSNVYSSYVVSPLEGIKNYCANSNIDVLTEPVSDLSRVKEVCKNADAVIVVAGNNYKDEGEFIGDWKIRDKNNPDKKNAVVSFGILALGGDRKHMHLHDEDIKAIHAASSVNKNIAVVLVGGSAIMVEEWNTEVQAILQSFYNGMEGGNALARILFGDVNPSGKLPFSVPKNENALPPFNSFNTEVEYGYYHGYMLMDKNNIEPRYPFGYGLSYTNFQIYELKSESESESQKMIKFSVKIKNIGPVAGAEVVQLYIGFSNSNIDRPRKLLKGFQKVYLQPGETRTLNFNVPVKEFKYYDPSTSSWKLENMKYEVMVGNSSSDDKMLSDKFLIE